MRGRTHTDNSQLSKYGEGAPLLPRVPIVIGRGGAKKKRALKDSSYILKTQS